MFKVVGFDPGTVNLGVVVVKYCVERGYRVTHSKMYKVTSARYQIPGVTRKKRQVQAGYCSGIARSLKKTKSNFLDADICAVENQNFGEKKTRLLYHGIQWGVAGYVSALSTDCHVSFIDSATKFAHFKKLELEIEAGKSGRNKTKDKSMALASSLIKEYSVSGARGIPDNNHLSDAFGVAMCALDRRLKLDESLRNILD
jgi:Holliday junction resolvasome RuvABC endonuclease subunit